MYTILVIDSNESILLLLDWILTHADYQVAVATTGAEGIALALSLQPHIIIVSDYLPLMAGREVCLQLKHHPQTRHIPAILSTAANVPDPLAYARQIGASGVLRQPFRARDVFTVLESYLRQ